MVYIVRKNKLHFFVFLMLILFSLNACGQVENSNNKLSAKSTDQDSLSKYILDIRRIYNTINSDSAKIKCIEGNENGQSEEGGLYKKCYIKGELVKALFIFYGESGRAVYEYYFEKQKLVFELERTEYYDSTIDAKSNNIARADENRFYFWNDRLIRWIDSRGQIVDKDKYSTKQKELLSDLKAYLEN